MVFFTSILSNYLDKSLALAESILRHHPDSEVRIYVFDFETACLPDTTALRKHLNLGSSKRVPTFHSPKSCYSSSLFFEKRFNVVECCTAVKPFIFLSLLQEYDLVTYLDPDIYAYSAFEFASNQSDSITWDLQVTPHVLSPANFSSLISERLFANFGIFNLGYLSARKTDSSLKFIRWWASMCGMYGIAQPRAGLYVDQKPFDFAPAFVDKLNIVKHPGWNIAWWNILCDGRTISPDKTVKYQGSNYKIIFFHFSNLDNDSEMPLIAKPLHHLLTPTNRSKAKLSLNRAFADLLIEYQSRTSDISRKLLQKSTIKLSRSKRSVLAKKLIDESFRRSILNKDSQAWEILVSTVSDNPRGAWSILRAINVFWQTSRSSGRNDLEIAKQLFLAMAGFFPQESVYDYNNVGINWE